MVTPDVNPTLPLSLAARRWVEYSWRPESIPDENWSRPLHRRRASLIMIWWKVGLIGSILWLIGVVVIGSAVVISIMNAHPHDRRNAQVRSEKAGRAVGAISAPILMGIWFFAWRRRPTSEPVEIAERPSRRKPSSRG